MEVKRYKTTENIRVLSLCSIRWLSSTGKPTRTIISTNKTWWIPKCFLPGKGYVTFLLLPEVGSLSHVEPTVHTNVVG